MSMCIPQCGHVLSRILEYLLHPPYAASLKIYNHKKSVKKIMN